MPAPTVVELLWGTGRQSTRGPKPSLSLEAIVGAAIELADAEGMGGVSMQRVAERLGYTKMSLYRYVPGKAELAALMLEQALGAPPDLAAAQSVSDESPWRAGLRTWTEEIFRRYRAHPWSLELSDGVRPMGPHELGWLEAALTTMAGIGLTGPERLDTVVVLNGHVRSLALQSGGGAADGIEEQLMHQMAEVMEAAGDRYPEVIRALGEQAAGTSARDDALNFGIDRILDGLEALVDRRKS
ncbi:TetR/AcrR family transcriptional regulator [Nocardia cyriacigeorgica]|uniref:TetR/AcrR family transcriptional regulator n=1 Tax=Nocardia cyriacigeorgica TaxID=135487 RepID=A0A6P1DGU6_9NOCA|nr:TetR/AcrR family transcriptional regulator [Nocardia cyriacigeorgica]NEW42278.1 TetR/AcrR family transcriptional regulator [Nocardia cyriacigeorgica]NEW47960.1 TetR/AcrR family transcriptional regulator [Nocardia cyriacigeorgica]NEW58162.1 TetR/AcrR family transcriptional regulator [Nocardia cyriacigeorgica]